MREHYAHGGRLFDDKDRGAPLHAGRLEQARRAAPHIAAQLTQIIVDNPVPFGVAFAGGIVISRAAVSIVRPRTPLEALALFALIQAGIPVLARQAIERGWLKFRVRNEAGQLVPLIPGKTEPGNA